MLFYGTGLWLAYIILTLVWNIGGGYNELFKKMRISFVLFDWVFQEEWTIFSHI
jgi:hypothetical protein